MQHRSLSFSHRTRALMLVMVLLGIILPGAALHAGIQYSVGIESLIGRTSTNGTLSGMQVRVGKFTGGFAPSLANYNQWLANFVPLMPAGALAADGTAFITAAAPNTGPWKMTNRTLAVNLGQDPAGFANGDPIYIWISNATSSAATTQVALLTDASWIYKTATENPQPSVTFVLRSEAPTLVAGTSFNDSYADASGEPGLLLVTAAIPMPEIAVEQPVGSDVPTGGSRSFGSVSVGSSASLQFTIKNTGNADLTGLTITKDGSDAAEFSLTASPVAPVSGPSGSTTFTVEFVPTSTGPKAAVIHIASNDLDESPFDITLGGTGISPEIAVEHPAGTGLEDGSSTVGYGSVPMAPGVTKSFTIRNAGNADLTGIVITKDGAQSGDFVVDVTGMSTTILPGASTSFTVRFTPGAIGARAAALHIASNDLDEAVFDIDLTGTGTALNLAANYTTGAVVPLTTATLTATGSTVGFTLNHTPVTGATLMVVKMTGLDFIQGTFSNLAQGQVVTLSYGGITYSFVADYFGGTGNDLVLRWANTKAWGWGENGSSQMGDGGAITDRLLPTPASVTGLLAGKTILTLAPGPSHCVALCSDGTVAVWGSDSGGRLGRGPLLSSSSTPVTVDTTGVLAGRRVISVSSGLAHSLALCADGTLVAWGRNADGELGIGGASIGTDASGNPIYADEQSPVLVNTAGALAGKTVAVLQATYAHSLALCTDGTLYAWGHGGSGRLGNGTNNIDSPTPAAVSTSGALAGKSVVMVAGGGEHNLALCSDGTLVAWGEGGQGRLGTGDETDSYVPVNITNQGVLATRTVVAISAGMQHSLALCSDGTVAAWGLNANGQLGNNSTAFSLLPVAVSGFGQLAGRTVVSITAGHSHSVAYCSDGSVVAWGNNASGQLGDGSTTQSLVPVLVSTSTLPAGHRFISGFTSQRAEHCVGLVAGPATTPVQDWRQLYFGTTSNSGNAADSFDYDNDGLVNLLEWAFGLNPTSGSSNQIPQATLSGGIYTVTFATPPGVSGITYGAEWSTTMAANDWHVITDTGTGGHHTFSVSVNGSTQLFVRLKVTTP